MHNCNIPKIVIVGGGAGGLQLTTKLSRTLGRSHKAEITLIDETLAHLWKPSLHEFAAGTKGADEQIDFVEHANRFRYQFRLGRFAGLDLDRRLVLLEPVTDADNVPLAPRRQISFDYLVLAIGSRSNDFGCAGAVDNCWFLDTPAQARRLQTQLLNLCLRLETGALGEEKSRLNVCIVGGGATGVELAAELHEATGQFGLHGIDKLRHPHSFNITLLEGAPRILAALPASISTKVASKLKKIEIDVRTSARVSKVNEDSVELEDGTRICTEMVVWAAGIKAPKVLNEIAALELGSLGRVLVRPTLQVTGSDIVFAMGDCAACEWPEKGSSLLPPRAQVASQQATFLSRQLERAVRQEPLTNFVYVDRGSLVAISHHSAIGALMGKAFGSFTIEGVLARWAYRYLHLAHETCVQGRFRAISRAILSKAMKRLRPQFKVH